MDNELSIKESCYLIEVANGSTFGYNFKICPKANLNDGILEVVMIKAVAK